MLLLGERLRRTPPGRLAQLRGDLSHAAQLMAECLPRLRRRGDQRCTGRALYVPEDTRWPAHLHVDVAAPGARTGAADGLMDRWLGRLWETGSPDSHLQSS